MRYVGSVPVNNTTILPSSLPNALDRNSNRFCAFEVAAQQKLVRLHVVPMDDKLQSGIWPDLIERIRARTPARVLADRSGAAYRTGTQLELRQNARRSARPDSLD